jgi:hypothetical protein
MRTSIRTLIVSALAALLFVSTASAGLLVYEPFNYNTPNRVLGQSNASTGTSWLLAAAAGASGDTTAINVASGNLSVPSILPPVLGNSATVNGVGNLSGASDRLAISATDPAISTGSVYYSMALRVDDLSGSNSTTGGFLFGLNNTGNVATGTNPTAVAARLQGRIDPNDNTKYNVAVFNNRNAVSTSSFWTSGLTVGETIFLVGSYDIANQISKIWINPSESTFANNSLEPAATLTDTTAGTAINIASIILRQSPAPFLTLDEIRVGTDWQSVTVPEPASWELLLIGGVVWFWRGPKCGL